jgi:hypothetical protein
VASIYLQIYKPDPSTSSQQSAWLSVQYTESLDFFVFFRFPSAAPNPPSSARVWINCATPHKQEIINCTLPCLGLPFSFSSAFRQIKYFFIPRVSSPAPHDIKNHWKRTLLHALRVVGSTIENNLNLRPLPYHPAHTFLLTTIYQRYWTHIVVPPPLKDFHNVALTAPFSGRTCTYYGEPRLTQKVGEVRYFFSGSLGEITKFYMRMYVYYRGVPLEMLIFPS